MNEIWLSVKDFPPKEKDEEGFSIYYLFCSKKHPKQIYYGTYEEKNKYWIDQADHMSSGIKTNITHYIHLPSQYVANQKSETFYAIMWKYNGKLHFVGNDPMTLEEAEDVMEKVFNHKNYFITKCEPIKKVKTVSKIKRRYLTAAELIKRREEPFVIESQKNGKFRSKCSGPIDDLEYKKGILSWTDEDGEVVIAVKLGSIIKKIPDLREPEFTHSVYENQ